MMVMGLRESSFSLPLGRLSFNNLPVGLTVIIQIKLLTLETFGQGHQFFCLATLWDF